MSDPLLSLVIQLGNSAADDKIEVTASRNVVVVSLSDAARIILVDDLSDDGSDRPTPAKRAEALFRRLLTQTMEQVAREQVATEEAGS